MTRGELLAARMARLALRPILRRECRGTQSKVLSKCMKATGYAKETGHALDALALLIDTILHPAGDKRTIPSKNFKASTGA
jgi:hypothetical protein